MPETEDSQDILMSDILNQTFEYRFKLEADFYQYLKENLIKFKIPFIKTSNRK